MTLDLKTVLLIAGIFILAVIGGGIALYKVGYNTAARDAANAPATHDTVTVERLVPYPVIEHTLPAKPAGLDSRSRHLLDSLKAASDSLGGLLLRLAEPFYAVDGDSTFSLIMQAFPIQREIKDSLWRAPAKVDTVFIQTVKTITLENTTAWWEIPSVAVGATIVGYLLGRK